MGSYDKYYLDSFSMPAIDTNMAEFSVVSTPAQFSLVTDSTFNAPALQGETTLRSMDFGLSMSNDSLFLQNAANMGLNISGGSLNFEYQPPQPIAMPVMPQGMSYLNFGAMTMPGSIGIGGIGGVGGNGYQIPPSSVEVDYDKNDKKTTFYKKVRLLQSYAKQNRTSFDAKINKIISEFGDNTTNAIKKLDELLATLDSQKLSEVAVNLYEEDHSNKKEAVEDLVNEITNSIVVEERADLSALNEKNILTVIDSLLENINGEDWKKFMDVDENFRKVSSLLDKKAISLCKKVKSDRTKVDTIKAAQKELKDVQNNKVSRAIAAYNLFKTLSEIESKFNDENVLDIYGVPQDQQSADVSSNIGWEDAEPECSGLSTAEIVSDVATENKNINTSLNSSGNTAGQAIKDNVNKDNVMSIIENYNSANSRDIMSNLTSKSVKQSLTCRIPKSLLRKAYELGLQNTDEYKELAEYYGAQGNPSDESFKLTKHESGKNATDSSFSASEVDRMLKNLIAVMKRRMDGEI